MASNSIFNQHSMHLRLHWMAMKTRTRFGLYFLVKFYGSLCTNLLGSFCVKMETLLFTGKRNLATKFQMIMTPFSINFTVYPPSNLLFKLLLFLFSPTGGGLRVQVNTRSTWMITSPKNVIKLLYIIIFNALIKLLSPEICCSLIIYVVKKKLFLSNDDHITKLFTH